MDKEITIAVQIVDAKQLMSDFAKDVVRAEPLQRQEIAAGYARTLAARDRALQAAEVEAAIATFKDDPENFLEIAEARLAEIRKS